MATQNPNSRTTLQRIFGVTPRSVTEEHKELRFTRARQGSHFFLISTFLLMLGIGSFIALFASWGPNDNDFKTYAWFCLLPAVPAFFTLRIGIHCVRHAYLLLSPMGLEVFPFFKPEQNLQIIFWSDIDSIDITSSKLTLHTNKQKTAGVVITLKPIAKAQISLLQKAILSRTASK